MRLKLESLNNLQKILLLFYIYIYTRSDNKSYLNSIVNHKSFDINFKTYLLNKKFCVRIKEWLHIYNLCIV